MEYIIKLREKLVLDRSLRLGFSSRSISFKNHYLQACLEYFVLRFLRNGEKRLFNVWLLLFTFNNLKVNINLLCCLDIIDLYYSSHYKYNDLILSFLAINIFTLFE